jgi:hypothetical protein
LHTSASKCHLSIFHKTIHLLGRRHTKNMFMNFIFVIISMYFAQTLVSCIVFYRSLLSLCPFSFGHCVVSPSIYSFLLSFWYLQTFLSMKKKWNRQKSKYGILIIRDTHLCTVLRASSVSNSSYIYQNCVWHPRIPSKIVIVTRNTNFYRWQSKFLELADLWTVVTCSI